MKRLITMTTTQGKTPEQVAAELKAGLDQYRQAEESPGVNSGVESEAARAEPSRDRPAH